MSVDVTSFLYFGIAVIAVLLVIDWLVWKKYVVWVHKDGMRFLRKLKRKR